MTTPVPSISRVMMLLLFTFVSISLLTSESWNASVLVKPSFILGLLLCEGILRIKHYFVLDYDVEMWRYANILKEKHNNPKINHVHTKNKSAVLQGVELKTNKHGQRDIDYNNSDLKSHDRSFLFIGSSITLGWGVKNKDTFINIR